MRKLFFLFLALVATTSLWAQTFQVGDLYYKITSSSAPYTVEVSDAESSITSAVIPSTVTYTGKTYSVTGIGECSFFNCMQLISIDIPNSITYIGYNAFWHCVNLKSIRIPNSVTRMDASVFSCCYALESVELPANLTEIANYTFNSCSALKNVTIPQNVIRIGEEAFSNCKSLETIHIPVGVKSIYRSTFKGTLWAQTFQVGNLWYNITSSSAPYAVEVSDAERSITSAVIPSTVTYNGTTYSVTGIGECSFSNCMQLTSIDIPNSITYIGYNAFWHCVNLKSIRIPNSVTRMDASVFSCCYALESVELPANLTEIANYTFNSCSALKNVTIPQNVIRIGEEAFSNCKSLETIHIPVGVKSIYRSTFKGTAYHQNKSNWKKGGLYIDDCLIDVKHERIKRYRVKDGTRLIATAVFDDCHLLKSVTVPTSVTDFGDIDISFINNKDFYDITYQGTIAQWQQIHFSECMQKWGRQFEVHCTDGDTVVGTVSKEMDEEVLKRMIDYAKWMEKQQKKSSNYKR